MPHVLGTIVGEESVALGIGGCSARGFESEVMHQALQGLVRERSHGYLTAAALRTDPLAELDPHIVLDCECNNVAFPAHVRQVGMAAVLVADLDVVRIDQCIFHGANDAGMLGGRPLKGRRANINFKTSAPTKASRNWLRRRCRSNQRDRVG